MARGEDRMLDFAEREIVLRAEFDQLDEEHCVWTSVRFMLKGPRRPAAGEWVYLIDSDGRGCLGRVESLNGWSARVCPDWSSWTPADDLPAGAPPPASQ